MHIDCQKHRLNLIQQNTDKLSHSQKCNIKVMFLDVTRLSKDIFPKVWELIPTH